MDLTTINQMQYTAALLITTKVTPPNPATNRKPRGRPPAWQQRLQKQIDQLRGDISIITEYTKGNTTNKIRRTLKTFLKKHKIKANEQFIACKEDVKQALQAKAQRIRRCTKRSEQYKQKKDVQGRFQEILQGTRKEVHPDWETARHRKVKEVLIEHTGAGGQIQ